MKSTVTIKSLGAALLIFSGSVSFAQSNGAAMSPAADATSVQGPASKQYTLVINESRSGLLTNTLSADFSTSAPIVGELGRKGGFLYTNVNIPNDLPLGTVVLLTHDGKPLWHVTVADILGQTEGEGSEQPAALSPIDITGVISGGGASSYTNPEATSLPAQPSNSTTIATQPIGINKSQPKLDLFPNPATEHITIVTEGEVLWGVTEVIDLTGKKVLEIPTGINVPSMGIDRFTIPVSQLKPGTYLVRFKTDKDIYTKRFQVTR